MDQPIEAVPDDLIMVLCAARDEEAARRKKGLLHSRNVYAMIDREE
jgi:hypothetical protein